MAVENVHRDHEPTLSIELPFQQRQSQALLGACLVFAKQRIC